MCKLQLPINSPFIKATIAWPRLATLKTGLISFRADRSLRSTFMLGREFTETCQILVSVEALGNTC